MLSRQRDSAAATRPKQISDPLAHVAIEIAEVLLDGPEVGEQALCSRYNLLEPVTHTGRIEDVNPPLADASDLGVDLGTLSFEFTDAGIRVGLGRLYELAQIWKIVMRRDCVPMNERVPSPASHASASSAVGARS